jgi:hypothetical protein
MGVLVWLAAPIGATVVAIGWVHWASRPRGPADAVDSLAAHERFKAAMAAPVRRDVPRQRPRPRQRVS